MYSKELASIALGQKMAELVLKNARIVQVLSDEIIEGDIAISHGLIIGIGSFKGKEEIDLHGQFVCPGFIDAHLHLESTLVKPSQLIHCASLCGTTTFIADPHEAANVSGTLGITYILNETSQCKSNVYIMMPSCVPSAPFEDNGYTLSAKDMKPYLNHPRILGLGEVMDSASVLSCEKEMMRKLSLFQDKVIDGHAGFLSDMETQCYHLAGIHTDHECCTFSDALREVRAGFYILIREGTAAHNLEAIVSGLISHHISPQRFCFCTDDKHIEDIKQNGHISNNIRKAINLGMTPMDAIKMATIHPANCYKLSTEGAIAPGRQANLVVLSDLYKVTVTKVFYHGSLIQEEEPSTNQSYQIPNALLHTVNVSFKGSEQLKLKVSDKAFVMEIIPGQIMTRKLVEYVPQKDGYFVPDATYSKIALLERHHASGRYGLGIVKGFSIKGGAIASTVGHDSHNMVVIGDNDIDMERAIKALCECQGGYTIAKSGEDCVTQPLSIMGLMSLESHEKVQKQLKRMIAMAYDMGVVKTIDPFITMSFLALPVIPELRITTRGVYDVTKKEFVT